MTEKQLFEGIATQDSKIIEFIYKKFFPSIKFLIFRMGGEVQDAEDVFNEALIILFLKIRDNSDFEVSVSLKSYLIGVSKYIWLGKIRKEKNLELNTISSEHIQIDSEDFENQVVYLERRNLLIKSLESLSADCKQLISLYMDGRKMNEIATIMGYKSDRIAKKKKFLCKEYLIKIMKKYPEFKELFSK